MRLRGLLVAVLVTALLGVVLAEGAQTTPAERCERLRTAATDRAATVTGSGDRVLVVGDSWSAGFRLQDPTQGWPARLPGRVFVEGFPGSGYSVRASACGPVSYGQRVGAALERIRPDLVVVQGGLNDVDRPDAEIAAGLSRVLAAVSPYDVVVVGPAAAPRRAPAVPRVDALLARLCAERGVRYVSTTDLRLPYLRDRLHPTDEGHRIFGDAVAERIAIS